MLSKAHSKVIRLIATEGLANKEIAARLGLSEATVKVHVRTVLLQHRKDAIKNRTQLALYYATRLDQLEAA